MAGAEAARPGGAVGEDAARRRGRPRRGRPHRSPAARAGQRTRRCQLERAADRRHARASRASAYRRVTVVSSYALGLMSTVPAVTVGGLLEARPESIGLPIELLAGRARPRSPHHQSLYPEDRPGARRLPRVPAARPRADLRRERGALSRGPRRRSSARGAWPDRSRPTCHACWSPAASRRRPTW